MESVKNWLLAASVVCSACSLIFSGCSSDPKSNLEGCEDYVYVDSLSNSHVYGFVSDADGNALANVLVITGEDTTLTNEDGVYSFDRCRAVNGRCVVKFEDDEFFSVIRTADIVDGEARVDALLMPLSSREGVTEVTRFFSGEGATIKVGKLEISIPANAVVYEDGQKEFNGSVCASVYYLNPSSENFAKEMPGGDMSGVTAEGKNVILLSYGMVEVTLKDSMNQKLQLKDGMESSMTFPVPDGFSKEQLHDEIPLWYFDEEKGTWVEEGIATKNGDSYSGKVKHFSWHNVDYPELRATIEGRVLNQNGKPLPNVLVTISQTCARSDSNGYYWAYVPKNTPVFVTVRPSDYGNCTNCPIYQVDGLEAKTTYTQDVILPNVTQINGVVRDKKGRVFGGCPVCVNGVASAVSDRRGRYSLYVSGSDSISLYISEKYAINMLDKSKTYVFKTPSEIDENQSYDFTVSRITNVSGWVEPTKGQYRYLNQPVFVTAILDGKEYRVKTSLYGYYIFKVIEETKEISCYVKADDGFGVESSRVSKDVNGYYVSLPVIYLPTGVSVSGTVYNSCGPSSARVTIESGRGKNKKVFTLTTHWGYFNITLPLYMKGADAKVKIRCQGKKVSKRIHIDSDDISLGTFDVCTGEKPEPNCIYAIIGDETVKFDTRKGPYTEMFQVTKNQIYGKKSMHKYQAWYKSPDTDATLVLEIDSVVANGNRNIENTVVFYLVSDEFSVSKTNYVSSRNKSAQGIYTFKTDIELYDDSKNDGEGYYFYGSADIKNKKIDDYIDENYIPKNIYWNASKVLVGVNENTKFYTSPVDQNAIHGFENALKRGGFKEKSTFMDDEQRISTIFIQDNAEAIIHRNKDKASDVTILMRDGIGSEPLYNCWKVDFRNSSLKKGGSGVDYLWKNEADIAQLVMFGPMMGVKFTKAADEKCGCFEGIVPAVASK